MLVHGRYGNGEGIIHIIFNILNRFFNITLYTYGIIKWVIL